MPELPEVETTRRGVAPHVRGCVVEAIKIHERRLREPVTRGLVASLTGQTIHEVQRRAKYLLFDCGSGTLIVHLGMSGSLRVVPQGTPNARHDHVDIHLSSGQVLRFRDPRRFGLVLWTVRPPEQHKLLRNLGPEPFDPIFDGALLWQRSRGRRGAIKNFVMDNHIVVGVGNIYASESLFRAGIHPRRAAGRISASRYAVLCGNIRDVLSEAIAAGGTTLRDFVHSDGNPGYFRHNLSVYGRAGEACPRCGSAIRNEVIGQRSSFFCVSCQR